MTKTVQATKPKLFPIWPFTEKVSNVYHKIVIIMSNVFETKQDELRQWEIVSCKLELDERVKVLINFRLS